MAATTTTTTPEVTFELPATMRADRISVRYEVKGETEGDWMWRNFVRPKFFEWWKLHMPYVFSRHEVLHFKTEFKLKTFGDYALRNVIARIGNKLRENLESLGYRNVSVKQGTSVEYHGIVNEADVKFEASFQLPLEATTETKQDEDMKQEDEETEKEKEKTGQKRKIETDDEGNGDRQDKKRRNENADKGEPVCT